MTPEAAPRLRCADCDYPVRLTHRYPGAKQPARSHPVRLVPAAPAAEDMDFDEITDGIIERGLVNQLRRIVSAYRNPQKDDPHRLDDEIAGTEAILDRLAAALSPAAPATLDIGVLRTIMRVFGVHLEGGVWMVIAQEYARLAGEDSTR